MDSNEIKTILLTVKQVGDFVRKIDPNVDHVSMYSIGNNADFVAWAGDYQSFSAHMFDDGSFRISNDYYHADGTFKGDEKAC